MNAMVPCMDIHSHIAAHPIQQVIIGMQLTELQLKPNLDKNNPGLLLQ